MRMYLTHLQVQGQDWPRLPVPGSKNPSPSWQQGPAHSGWMSTVGMCSRQTHAWAISDSLIASSGSRIPWQPWWTFLRWLSSEAHPTFPPVLRHLHCFFQLFFLFFFFLAPAPFSLIQALPPIKLMFLSWHLLLGRPRLTWAGSKEERRKEILKEPEEKRKGNKRREEKNKGREGEGKEGKGRRGEERWSLGFQ